MSNLKVMLYVIYDGDIFMHNEKVECLLSNGDRFIGTLKVNTMGEKSVYCIPSYTPFKYYPISQQPDILVLKKYKEINKEEF